MGVILTCDLCPRKLRPEEVYILKIVKETEEGEKPAIQSIDMCPHCKETLKEWLIEEKTLNGKETE